MPLSQSVIAELSAERLTLHHKIDEYQQRLDAIDLLLRKSPAAAKPAGRQKRTKRKGTVIADIETVSSANVNRALMPEMDKEGTIGLRAILKKALMGHRPAKPAEVILMVRARGFVVKGKTPLETRVYNELKRMLRDGLLDREEGKYRLKAA